MKYYSEWTPHPLLQVEYEVNKQITLTLICWMRICGTRANWRKSYLDFSACILHSLDMEDNIEGQYTTVPLDIPPHFDNLAKIRTATEQSRKFFYEVVGASYPSNKVVRRQLWSKIYASAVNLCEPRADRITHPSSVGAKQVRLFEWRSADEEFKQSYRQTLPYDPMIETEPGKIKPT